VVLKTTLLLGGIMDPERFKDAAPGIHLEPKSFITAEVEITTSSSTSRVESAPERDSRLRREEQASTFRHRRDLILSSVGLTILLVLLGASLWIVLKGGYADKVEGLAISYLTSLFGAVIGFVFAKASVSKSE
jgi:hypothetical protein